MIVDLLIGAGCNIDAQEEVRSLFAFYYDSLICLAVCLCL